MTPWTTLNAALRAMLLARGAKSATAHVAGSDWHYYRLRGKGRGPPVLLVHGLGASAHTYSKLLFPLRRIFSEVIAPDLPGNGYSPNPASLPKLERQVEVLLRFQTQVIGRPAVWIGNSLGGAMTLWAASQAKHQVMGLVAMAPAGAQWSEEARERVLGHFRVRNRAEAMAMTERLFYRAPWSAKLAAPMLQEVFRSQAVQHVINTAADHPTLSPEMLAQIGQPAMLLWGRGEKILPPDSLGYFRRHLPVSAEIHELPDVGHMPQMEQPKMTLDLIERFARRNGWMG